MSTNHPIRIDEFEKRIDEALSLNERANELNKVENPPGVDRMSSAGRCVRERWAAFRGLPLDPDKGFAVNPRMLRVFGLGHAIEDEIVRILEDAGYVIEDSQREVGEGKWIGHIDGLIRDPNTFDPPRLFEAKSVNVRGFEEVQEIGLRAWRPGYYAQAQAYMHFLPGVDECVFAIYCKDTSALYFELILYDVDEATRLQQESLLVTQESAVPPPKPEAATSKSCQFCKWCDRSGWCWSALAETVFDD